MAEWKECTISEIGTVVGGATPSTKIVENYEGGTIAWITPKDLSTFKGRYISNGDRNITEMGLKSCSTQLLPKDTVLFSSRAPIGYVAIAENEVCTNQGFKSVIPNSDTDPLFLFYLLKYNKSKIENMGSGTTFKEVSGNTMKSIKVNIPCEYEEQKKIASVLDAIDNKIEENEKVNNNLEQQARALYQEWFCDFTPFGGLMPNDWKTGKLKDILRLRRESIKAGDNPTMPYLPIDVIPMNTFAVSYFKSNDEAQSSLITFDKDDIVIGAMRVYFHRVILAPCKGITRTTCFTLTPYDSSFLSYALLCCDRDSSIDYAQATSKGSTMPYAIWEGGLGDMEIVIPTPKVALDFNDLTQPMLRQIQSSYFENRDLRIMRDSLLPKLMSGELDVSEIDL
ncbi:restriction endonuclease subunit S [Aminicella lysinilytica]|uniref:Type I restriction enzyme S subunit n=1 Tax=Aminicella lysinilytica TaxID=433323 RepID=A0A4R6Q413_9FIRM|nr:restriction endonuclease subunit S [Aminicella lysinilytica]TDP56416.1 type I restriction enzyme S subunit [Aminicella lysinilytica]